MNPEDTAPEPDPVGGAEIDRASQAPEAPPESSPRPSGLTHLYQPYVVVPVLNGAVATFYLWAGHGPIGLPGLMSLVLSTLAGMGLLYVLLSAVPPKKAFAIPVSVLLATALTALHVVHLGYYQVFKAPVPVSVINYARQLPLHSAHALREYFTVGLGLFCAGSVVGLGLYLYWGIRRVGGTLTRRRVIVALLPWVALPLAAAHPYLSLGQYTVATVVVSLCGSGQWTVHFVPDRIDLPPLDLENPVNVVFFELESISTTAMQICNPDLPTTPYWVKLRDERPDEVFVAANHFSNSSASDVAIPMIYTGAAADDPLRVHKSVPLIWDYAKAAGYDTSLFMACSLTWGDFDTRFQHHEGVMNLDHIVHAFNADRPLVHDLSMNDADVMEEMIQYLRGRDWPQPFLACVSLKMPHFLGQGAKLNGFTFLNDRLPDEDRLIHYYNAIYHNDQLMGQFIELMPPEVRRNTVIAVTCDHGEDLYGRGARLDNYHIEIAHIPWLMYVPQNVQSHQRPGAMENLRHNIQNVATSNLDVVPTLLDLMGLADEESVREILAGLQGQSLLEPKPPPEFIVMLNTNDLRSWDREGFALTMDNGTVRYVYDMGRKGLYDLTRDPREERDLMDDPAYADYVRRAEERIKSDYYLMRIVLKYGGP